jgi:uncharacterized protein (TIGR03086 family)
MTSNDIPATYARRAAPFTAVVDRLPAAAWDAPSPCEGWAARDVLDHVMSSQRGFLTERGIALPATEVDPTVTSDPVAAWHQHDMRMQQLLARPEVRDHAYDGVFGATTVGRSLVDFHGFDLIVHRWDIAAAAALDERFTDDELDVVERSADGFGDHLYDEGVCRPALSPTEGADRQERVLARLGRRTPVPDGVRG